MPLQKHDDLTMPCDNNLALSLGDRPDHLAGRLVGRHSNPIWDHRLLLGIKDPLVTHFIDLALHKTWADEGDGDTVLSEFCE